MLEALRVLSILDGSFNVLVIAPLAVAKYTWPSECRRWTPGFICEYLQDYEPANGRVRINTVNYERIPQIVEEKNPYQIIIADEATKLKGFRLRQGTKRSRALAGIAFDAERFIELTGTPAPNGLLDLWGQIWFLDRGARLGASFSAFSDRWFTVGYDGFSQKALPTAIREIPRRLNDICLSIRAKDCLDMPPQIEQTIPVELPEIAFANYLRMENQFFATIEDVAHEAVNALSKSSKLLQMASGCLYTHHADGAISGYQPIHSVKLDALGMLLDQLSEPLLVSYQHRFDAERIQSRFPEARVLCGDRDIRDWNEGRIRVLLAHPGSAGHGLNLQQGGRAICFFSTGWNLEHTQQMIERIGPARQAQLGRTSPVLIYYIVAMSTIDEAIIERQRTKAEVQDVLRGYMTRRRME